MKIISLVIVSLLIHSACSNCKKANKTADSTDQDSAWLDAKIEEAKQEGYTEISSYLYLGDTVFLFVPPCCDRFSELYASSGSLICHPSGGITGKGDGRCKDFFKEAKKIESFDIEN